MVSTERAAVAGVLSTALAVFSFSSCRSAPPPARPAPMATTTVPPTPVVPEAIDPLLDLVAVLPGGGSVLCAQPDEVDRAIALLGAEPQPDGSYVVPGASAIPSVPASSADEVATRPLRFEVLRTNVPYLCSDLFRHQQPHVSSIVDLIAYMPSSGKELCVHPDYVGVALHHMMAEPLGDGSYAAQLPEIDGSEAPTRALRFTLKHTYAPVLCAFGGDEDDERCPDVGRKPQGSAGAGGDDPLPNPGGTPNNGSGGAPASGNPNTAGAPNECDLPCETPPISAPPFVPYWNLPVETGDPPRPGIPELARGVYEIYKDADCNRRVPAGERCEGGLCSEKPPFASSVKHVFPEHRQCGKGFGFCVEVRSVPMTSIRYMSTNCEDPEMDRSSDLYPGCNVFDNTGTNPGGPSATDVAVQADGFRLYRNATCVTVQPAQVARCEPPGPTHENPPAPYVVTVTKALMECRRGNGYCVQTQLPLIRHDYYDTRSQDGQCAVFRGSRNELVTGCLP
jgi:hypothetical protein